MAVFIAKRLVGQVVEGAVQVGEVFAATTRGAGQTRARFHVS